MKNKNKGIIREIKKPGAYPVQWLVNALELGGSGELGHLGLCGYSKEVAFIDSFPNPIQTIEVKEVTIKNGDCSHSEHCLNLKCGYNKTTGESLVGYLVISEGKMSEKDRKKVVAGFDITVQLIENANKIITRQYPQMKNFNKYSTVQCTKPLVRTTRR